MAIKKILGDIHDAFSIAQAGIKGTLDSLRKERVKPKKRTKTKRTPKMKPRAHPKKKRPAKNPTDPNLLARSVIEAATGEALTPKPKRKAKPLKKKGRP